MIYGRLLDDVEHYIFRDKRSRFCTLDEGLKAFSQRRGEQEEAKFIV